ncbi:hypothetical protein ACFZB4_19050 [Streptomyces pseudovenezuelae]|uniref:hypothetical protein n=1 Tax=Streptomyces pseudovenezuelae TaxID=67350 RepID=UPI0036E10431
MIFWKLVSLVLQADDGQGGGSGGLLGALLLSLFSAWIALPGQRGEKGLDQDSKQPESREATKGAAPSSWWKWVIVLLLLLLVYS